MTPPTEADPARPLDASERELLELVQRFLVNVSAPDIAPVALALAYDGAEHAEGWRLFGLAAGTSRPLEHSISAAQRVIAMSGDEQRLGFRRLDEFENRWFPRTEAALRRFVDAKHREAAVTGFFADMPQQAEGPLVVGSVEKFLARFAQLAGSSAPGAAAAHASLARRGLDADTLGAIAALVTKLKAQPAAACEAVSEQQRQDSAICQRAALDPLRLWYRDWAETFRGTVGYHVAVRLGIREVKGGRPRAAAPAETPSEP